MPGAPLRVSPHDLHDKAFVRLVAFGSCKLRAKAPLKISTSFIFILLLHDSEEIRRIKFDQSKLSLRWKQSKLLAQQAKEPLMILFRVWTVQRMPSKSILSHVGKRRGKTVKRIACLCHNWLCIMENSP